MDLDIRPVIEHYGSDVPKMAEIGVRWKPVSCINPEHPDENASASTNGLGLRCHACGFSGNAITTIMRLEGLNVAGSLRFYEGLSGEKLAELSQPAKRGRKRVSDGSGHQPRDSSQVPPGARRRPRSGA